MRRIRARFRAWAPTAGPGWHCSFANHFTSLNLLLLYLRLFISLCYWDTNAAAALKCFTARNKKRLNFMVSPGALSQSSHCILSEPFQSFAHLEGELSRMEAVNKSPEIFVLFISLSAIYGVGLSGSITMLICFQSSRRAPFLKSKIDMFSAAVPPALCFNSVWVWNWSIAETCFTSCCAAYNYRAWISPEDYT